MAPRIAVLKLCAEVKGLDPQALVRMRMRYVETYRGLGCSVAVQMKRLSLWG